MGVADGFKALHGLRSVRAVRRHRPGDEFGGDAGRRGEAAVGQAGVDQHFAVDVHGTGVVLEPVGGPGGDEAFEQPVFGAVVRQVLELEERVHGNDLADGVGGTAPGQPVAGLTVVGDVGIPVVVPAVAEPVVAGHHFAVVGAGEVDAARGWFADAEVAVVVEVGAGGEIDRLIAAGVVEFAANSIGRVCSCRPNRGCECRR